MPWVREIRGPAPGTLHRVWDGCVLGRDADVSLDSAGISRRHAMISIDPEGVWLQDLGSSNGTFVNGSRASRRRLTDGDQLILGDVHLKWLEFDPAPDRATPPRPGAGEMRPAPTPLHLLRVIMFKETSANDLVARFDQPTSAVSRSSLLDENGIISKLEELVKAGLIEPVDTKDSRSLLRVTTEFQRFRDFLGVSLGRLIREREHSQDVEAAREMRRHVREFLPDQCRYKEEIVRTLEELSDCLRLGCYAASIMLCGRLLEVALRRLLFQLGPSTDKHAKELRELPLGPLLGRIGEHSPLIATSPHLKNVANMIKEVRNPTVHAHGDWPTLHRLRVVLHATREVVEEVCRRTLTNMLERSEDLYLPDVSPPTEQQWSVIEEPVDFPDLRESADESDVRPS